MWDGDCNSVTWVVCVGWCESRCVLHEGWREGGRGGGREGGKERVRGEEGGSERGGGREW